MRLIFDLFPCQTDSRLRGIGRYTLSLAQAMAAERGAHELRLLANGLYPDTAASLRHAFGGLAPPGAYSSYTHPPLSAAGVDEARDEQIASALIHAAYQSVRADAVLCASPFEGWCERGMAAQSDGLLPQRLRVAVLYDLIPLLFPEQHLAPSPAYAAWYRRRLDNLQQADLLLAISEATRDDAIRLLGIAPERVVNIGAAADAHFRRLEDREAVDAAVRQLGIVRPFVLYTGNGDYRKNLGGMLRAYALLTPATRRSHQLVVNQVGDLERFRTLMREAGLDEDEVVVTGRVDEDTLVSLYNACTVFVFPSLYEGFGLPVLEAMHCGAPVIAANNSSIPEVVGRADALFDAAEPAAIATSLERVLGDHAWRADLASHGLARARGFSWSDTARRAWSAIAQAYEGAHEQAGSAGLRVAVVHAAAPAGLTAATLDALARQLDLSFVDAAELAQARPAERTRAALAARLNGFDTVLYLLAAEAMSPALVQLMRAAPGVLWLTGAPHAAAAHAPDPALLLRDAGLPGLHAWLAAGKAQPPGRSLHEALHGLVLDDAASVAALRQRHGMALPPLAPAEAGPGQQAALLAGMLDAAHQHSPRRVAACIAANMQGGRPTLAAIDVLAAHAQANLMSGRAPRLLIDVTQLSETDALSGIQRVVRNVARELCLLEDDVPPIELVQLEHGVLRRAGTVAARLLGHPAGAVPGGAIDIHPGDLLFMIDSSWQRYPDFVPVFESVRRLGGRIVTVVYDLIPLRMPQFCGAGLVEVFKRWFDLAVRHSDMLLCISGAVRDDVAAYLDEHGMHPPHPLRLDYWRLGADIVPDSAGQAIRPEVAAMAADSASPLFLMVGTIEPRKGHVAVLDAFDALWNEGSQARLCLAGKEGWEVGTLMQRIRRHPELGRRLFFVERFTDAEINLCYSRAQALLAASVAEGYGLPIVEAAQHQVPVIASDIAVFREVAGAGAEYFPLGDQDALMALIRRFSLLPLPERQAMAARVEVLTWHDSARQALRKLQQTFS